MGERGGAIAQQTVVLSTYASSAPNLTEDNVLDAQLSLELALPYGGTVAAIGIRSLDELDRGARLASTSCSRGANVIGFTRSRALSERGRERGQDVRHTCGPLLPLASASVFGVLARDLSDSEALEAYALEWRRVLSAGGRVVVSGHGAGHERELLDFVSDAFDRRPSSRTLFSRAFIRYRLRPLLRDLGFREIRVQRIVRVVVTSSRSEFLDRFRDRLPLDAAFSTDQDAAFPRRVTEVFDVLSATR